MDKTQVTEPDYLVTLAEAKASLRVDFTAEDSFISDCIGFAQQYIEQETNLWLGEQTWDLLFDSFQDERRACRERGELVLPVSPLISVASIKYLDLNGVEQTLASNKYRVARGLHSRVTPAYGESWPDTLDVNHAVTIRVTGGYKLEPNLTNGEKRFPRELKKALLVLVGQFYEHRTAVYTGLQLREFPAHLSVKAACAHHGIVNQ